MNKNAIVSTSSNGNLPVLRIQTPWSAGEIYLHGAHLTHFQKNDEPPLLFMSAKSWFKANEPIRGGVPICFPWFGGREGEPSHGFARILSWEVSESSVAPDGKVKITLRLPQNC